MISNTKFVSFTDFYDKRGHLTPIESNIDVPFEIKRIYYITGVAPDVTRGYHSHRKLEQVLICLHGKVQIRVKTPYEEEVITLSSPNTGLYIGHMVWREMFSFTDNAVLLTLASEHYSEEDYIRSYDEYQKDAVEYWKSCNPSL